MQRCATCPSLALDPAMQKRMVPGDGPDDAEVVFIGEGPGRVENNMGRCFVGQTGEEYDNTYLMRCAGLDRRLVFTCNTVMCHWADTSDAPPEHIVNSCAGLHVRRYLQDINPRLVVLMGGVANSLMGWDVEVEHGIYHPDQELLGWRGDIYSVFHPALGLHKSSKMQALLDDFKALKHYVRGDRKPLESMCPNPVYERLTLGSEVREVTSGKYLEPCAIDTESIKRWNGFKSGIKYTPDRFTFCIEPPYAYLVMGKDDLAVTAFAKEIRKFRKLYMHNLPHDDWALSTMGIHIPLDLTYDTMSGAYHDGRLPKGLKALGLRLAGIRMTSFDDIVTPYGEELALEYLAEATLGNWPVPVQTQTGELLTKKCSQCKGTKVVTAGRGKYRKSYPCGCDGTETIKVMTRNQSLNQSISRVFTDIKKGSVDVIGRWESWTEKDHLLPAIMELMRVMGPIPLPSIDYVPDHPAMVYACGDALVTRIIGPIIERRVAEIRRSVR